MPRVSKIEDPVNTCFQLYQQGLTQEEIGKRYGLTQTMIGVYLRRHPDWRRVNRGNVPESRWPTERIDRVVALYATGISLAKVATAVGANRRHVRAVLQSRGVRIRTQSEAQTGQHNGFYKTGRTRSRRGYIYVLRPDHPNANKHGYVFEHRLVMEEKLGRLLLRGEVVHHRNGNRADNSPDNLQVFASNGEHLRHELKGRCPAWSEDGRRRLLAASRKPRRR